jgi:hypothetical protein
MGHQKYRLSLLGPSGNMYKYNYPLAVLCYQGVMPPAPWPLLNPRLLRWLPRA